MKYTNLNLALLALSLIIAAVSNSALAQNSASDTKSYEKVSLGDKKNRVQATLGLPNFVAFPEKPETLIFEDGREINVGKIGTATKKEIEARPRKEKDFDD